MTGRPTKRVRNSIRYGAGILRTTEAAQAAICEMSARGAAAREALSRFKSEATPVAVGLYITAAYWFTPSTSFANPAVTIARALTDSFAGIAPGDVPTFIVAQLCGALAGLALMRWFLAASDVFEREASEGSRTAPSA
jgi:glycerol uptake facilitator-like aquaporin